MRDADQLDPETGADGSSRGYRAPARGFGPNRRMVVKRIGSQSVCQISSAAILVSGTSAVGISHLSSARNRSSPNLGSWPVRSWRTVDEEWRQFPDSRIHSWVSSMKAASACSRRASGAEDANLAPTAFTPSQNPSAEPSDGDMAARREIKGRDVAPASQQRVVFLVGAVRHGVKMFGSSSSTVSRCGSAPLPPRGPASSP